MTLNVETDPLIRNFVTKSHAMCVCVCTCVVCVSKNLHMYLVKAMQTDLETDYAQFSHSDRPRKLPSSIFLSV